MEDKPKHPGGRPIRGDSNRKTKISIRLTDHEAELLNRCTEKLQTTKTGAIVAGLEALDKENPPPHGNG